MRGERDPDQGALRRAGPFTSAGKKDMRRCALWIVAAMAGSVGCSQAPAADEELPDAVPAEGSAAVTADADRVNLMIPLIEQRMPIFGITHPGITAGRGGEDTAAPDLAEVATETLAYARADYEYNSYSPRSADRFAAYMDEIVAAGGSAREHPFMAKIPIWHEDPAASAARVHQQLGAGHVGVFMQAVETAEEVRGVVEAMRFESRGGTRPEEGLELAARYWGLSRDEYLERADVWPLNPDGELLVWAIVESPAGIENVREIAAEPGLAAIVVGAGTLGGVFSSRNEEGERVLDQERFDAGVAAIAEACREVEKPCGYPANNAAEVEELQALGFDTFIMQRRNQEAFDAVEAGYRLWER